MKSVVFLCAAVLTYAAEVTVRQHFAVRTTTVKEKTVSVSKELYGYVTEDEGRIFDVVPRFSGYVEKLYVARTYTKVQKSRPLMQVYAPQVYKAKEEYLRSLLYAKKSASQGMVQSAKIKLKLLGVPKSEIDAIERTQKVSAYTTVYAPASGFVFKKSVYKGGAFAKDATVFRIVDLTKVWIRLKVNSGDIRFVKQAKKFRVRFESLRRTFEARLDTIEPQLNPNEALFNVRLVLNNDDLSVFPGMYAGVKAEVSLGKKPVLPTSALIRKNGKLYAFLVTEFQGEFDVVEVKAERVGDLYVVKSGLRVGDEVVKDAMFMMDSDAEINGLY